MKNYKNTIILAVVLVLLTGGYFGFKTWDTKKKQASAEEPTSTQTQTISIFKGESDKLTSLKINSTSEGVFEFKKTKEKVVTTPAPGPSPSKGATATPVPTPKVEYKDVWSIVIPANIKASADSMANMAASANVLVAEKLIEENAKNLADYGLDKPVCTVTTAYSDGKEHTFEIGNQNPTKDGYYVKDKGSAKVYLVSNYGVENFMKVEATIRDITMYNLKAEDVIALDMEKDGKPFFSAVKTDKEQTEEEKNAAITNQWEIVAPISAMAQDDGITSIVGEIVAPSPIEVYGKAPEGSGLETPSYAFTIKTAKESVRLLLGREKVNGQQMYAKIDGRDEVFLIDSSKLTFIDKPLNRIISTFAYLQNIKDVEKVVVNMDGKTYTLEIKCDPGNDNDKDVLKFNGVDVSALKNEDDSQLARKVYQGIIGITLNDILPNDKPSGTPEITFDYYLNDGGHDKIEFVTKDEASYYVLKNGKYMGISVAKSKFDEADSLRPAIKTLEDAMKK